MVLEKTELCSRVSYSTFISVSVTKIRGSKPVLPGKKIGKGLLMHISESH